jgi:polysaccharide pyruvyl transferase WcaK-like protein
MIIELRGLQFVNKGAELMLQAILQELSDSGLHYNLAMTHHRNSPAEKVKSLNILRKVALQKNRLNLNFITYAIPKFLRNYITSKFGIILESDVDVVLDGSGFAYGDQWGSMHILQVCSEIQRLHKHNKKYVFLPQALGPFTRPQDIIALKKALPKATLICAREQTSFENIDGLNSNKDNLIQYPDFTNIVKGIKPAYFLNGHNKFVIIPNNKMLSTKNANSEWSGVYVNKLVLLGKLAKKMSLDIVVLNHEGKKDKALCIEIEQKLGFEVEQIEESDPLKVKGIIGSCRALVCSRFHGCVSALSQGVPIIGTSWSFKYERLFSEYGQESFLLESKMNEEQVKQLFTNTLERNQGDLSKEVQKFKEYSRNMWNGVFKLIVE